MNIEKNQVYHGDCLEIMKFIDNKSIDCIICDLPYGTTACSWDIIIPFDKLWAQYERIIKDNGAIVLFGSQPFTTDLINSNRKLYKYNWIWEKSNTTGFMNANKMPLKIYEDICIYYKNLPIYNPQGVRKIQKENIRQKDKSTTIYNNMGLKNGVYVQEYTNYPKNIIKFDSCQNTIHPTQKPQALLQYLIRTYTNKSDLILDNCSGSGTTGIACLEEKRNYILIEQEKKYIDIINDRIKKWHEYPYLPME